MNNKDIRIEYMPRITEEQLWDFYVRNDICETGFGKETAVIPLSFPAHTVGAFNGDLLVGIIRAYFDGVSAHIIEFCLECSLQGDGLQYDNGSLIEKDEHGIAREMGLLLIDELRKLGNYSISATIVGNCEETVYESIGMTLNKGHLDYHLDERPYVNY